MSAILLAILQRTVGFRGICVVGAVVLVSSVLCLVCKSKCNVSFYCNTSVCIHYIISASVHSREQYIDVHVRR